VIRHRACPATAKGPQQRRRAGRLGAVRRGRRRLDQ